MRAGSMPLLLIVAAACVPRAAGAHPHVWIEAGARLQFEEGRLSRIAVEWTFDEMVSSLLVEDHDADGDGAFDADEQQEIADGVFAGLAEYGYFTVVRLDGETVPVTAVEDFSTRIAEDRRVVYDFTVPLPEPVDPRRTSVALLMLDDTYYVDIEYGDEAIHVEGDAAGCTPEIVPDDDHPVYFGLVIPNQIVLACGTA